MNRGARYAAKVKGEPRYKGVKPCPQCDGVLRYTASAQCVACAHARNAARRRATYAADPGAARAALRAQWQRTPIAIRRRWRRDASLRQKYGLSRIDFDRMLAAQSSVCAICYESLAPGALLRPVVDHDHETGRVRGILCDRCNHALGHLRDNPEIARRASLYLQGARDYA